jgi:hypothetical protein
MSGAMASLSPAELAKYVAGLQTQWAPMLTQFVVANKWGGLDFLALVMGPCNYVPDLFPILSKAEGSRLEQVLWLVGQSKGDAVSSGIAGATVS